MSATKETIIEAYSPPNPELWLSQLPFEELDLACEDILGGISRDDRFFADNTTEDVERLVREVGTLRIALRNGFQGMRTVDRSLLPGTPAIELEFNGPIDGDDASQYVHYFISLRSRATGIFSCSRYLATVRLAML